MENLKRKINDAISASHPISYIKTEEELEAIETIKSLTKGYLLLSYDEVEGILWLNEDSFKENKKLLIRVKNQIEGVSSDVIESLSLVRDLSKSMRTVLVIISADKIINDENPLTQKNIRFIKNMVNNIKEGNLLLSIFLISEKLSLPSLFEKDTLVFEIEYPTRDEIKNILEEFLNNEGLKITEELKTEYISALSGLTKSEIENLLYLAIINDGSLDKDDIDLFIDYKKQIVKKNAIIEYVDLRNFPPEIGGLKNLKEWLKRKKAIFKNIDKAIKNGVDIPKGVLLFGMPGCGKSMTAKYAAVDMGLPLLRLDMGRIMGQYLGQSEENLRKAIAIAESIAPSVLWIDEIEKTLSGVSGNLGNDTIVRIFGTLLTWMQEKTKPVFVIATANDIKSIPPEFLRKGRFDEIFFVDFPDKQSIEEIVNIHLRKRKKDPSRVDISKVAKKLSNKGYSGADIEAIVSETVERSFLSGKNEITTEDLEKLVDEEIVKPISKTMKNKIEELRKKCEELDAKNAN